MATAFYTWLTARTGKTTPVDADTVPLGDSVAASTKKTTWANVKATLKTYLDTLYQPLDTDLTAIAGLSSAADKVPYFTGAGTASVADFTAAGRALVDDATAAAQCTTLGLGTGDSPTFAGETIRAASPILTFKDSSCTDADANATITIAATDTGTGAEDIDVTFAQQVAGVATNFLVADADGSLTLGQANQPIVLNGPVGDVTLKDSSPTLLLIDSDATDGDAGVSIAASATATGAGAENVDLTITQQISGAAANVFVADADGDITIGNTTSRTTILSGLGKVQGATLTVYNATPSVVLIDSDTADKDAGVSIAATATTTTAGAEQVDATFAQQVAGSPVTFLLADADGSVTLGDGTRGVVLSGSVTSGDLTISNATPVLQFKDSSCAVADVNAYIEAVATDTGDGSEDIDVYIYQQVAGNPVSCFYADADGPVVIGYNGQPTIMSNASRVQSTAPVFKLIDTDAVDGDEGVSFSAAATTVTAGAEDVDFTISQQVGGSPVTFLNADADSIITIGDGIRKAYLPKLTALVPVIPNTATATPAVNDSGTVYTNEGDADGSNIILPTAAAGLHFTVCVMAAQTLTITANTSDLIRIGSAVTAAAGSITSSTIGSSITLVAVNAETWLATASVGSWSI